VTTNINTEQPKILAVEDDDSVRTTLRKVLESNRFQVSTAATVAVALNLIQAESFDVLLSDLHMPEWHDGFSVLSAMRKKNPHAVTLVFTAYPAPDEVINTLSLQSDELLAKPMAVTELLTLIREKLEKRETIWKIKVAHCQPLT
jgi:DNA-binding NtrC family response regulator